LAGARGELVRAIGRWDLTALVINGVIGAGIFGLPGNVFALIGSYSLIAFIACGSLVFLLILCFAEAGSRFRETGGPYLYAHAAFGAWAGFAIGWLAWLARVSSFAALANLFMSYLGGFAPAVEQGWPRALACSALTLALGVVNVLGVRGATRLNNFFTFGKLTPLLLFVIFGAFFVDGSRLAFGATPTLTDFSQAVLLLVYAFTGFETTIIPAGEMRDPGREIPFALITGTVVVTLVYLGVQIVCIGTLAGLGTSPRPLADAAQTFAGTTGAAAIALGALISIGGTLNANMLAGPRLLYAMSERGQMPAIFSRVHPRFRTPHVAVAVFACAALAAALSGGFIVLLLISTIARLLVYVSTCASVVALRRRSDADAARFKLSGGALIPGLALALCIWLLLHSTWQEAAVVAAALALGVVPYAAWRARTAR
jgi:amino acid transporter